MADDTITERGRRELLAWSAICVAASLLLVVQAWIITVHFPGWLYPGIFLLTVALSVLSYRGHRWARLALAGECGLLALAVAAAAIQGLAYSTITALSAAVIAVALAAASWRIAASSRIAAYVRQRSGAAPR